MTAARVIPGAWEWGADAVEIDGAPMVLLSFTIPGVDEPVGLPLDGPQAERLGEALFRLGAQVRGTG